LGDLKGFSGPKTQASAQGFWAKPQDAVLGEAPAWKRETGCRALEGKSPPPEIFN